jgi:hypothetical protein
MFLTLPNKIGSLFLKEEVQASVVQVLILKRIYSLEYYINYKFGYLFG